jgi:very-short-patch-repair endonuclease
MAKEQKSTEKHPDDSLAFIKEIAKYFMDFLETDFHRRKNPKRSIKFRNKDNLLVGVNLNKYPSFNSIVWKAINHGFDKNVLSSVNKGVYKTNIPKNLLDLIKFQVGKITKKQVDTLLKNIGEEIEKTAILNKNDYEKAFNDSLENASKIVNESLTLPFVRKIEDSLENMDLGDENSIYLMEEELTNVFISSLENKISEIIKRLLSEESVNASKELKQIINQEEIKNIIISFFESFKVTDLFSELFEMDRNKNILDKQEFYLYFCDITFNKAKYPIFYIPFYLVRQNESLGIEFDSQVYINKKALEYIVQEYNEEKGTQGSLKTISERIIYLAQYQNNFHELVNEVLNEIVNFFDLKPNIDVKNPDTQVAKGFWTRISNNCYIALFDKSDESLVNDYEEILQKLSEEDSVLAGAFNILIEDFIHKNPETFNPKVEKEWDNTKTSDRLVFRSPIPLNGEQLQTISALKKDGCKYTTVEGPPGTGKSHTITSVIFDAILEDQSVLVLSDKKEALDVVEDKITNTMNKVRHDKNFQNPILRLGKTGNTYSQILANSSIENIKTHYRAVRNDYNKLEKDIEKIESSLKEDLEAEIQSYENISMQEIQEFFELERQKDSIEEIIDVSELLKEEDVAVSIEEFRTIFNNFYQKFFNKNNNITSVLRSAGIKDQNVSSAEKLDLITGELDKVKSVASKIGEVFGEKISLLKTFDVFSAGDFNNLKQILEEYEELKNPILGYFLKGKQITALDLKFKKLFPGVKIDIPKEHLQELNDVTEIVSYIEKLCYENSVNVNVIDYIKAVHYILTSKENLEKTKEIFSLQDDVDYIKKNAEKYPNTFKKIGIDFLQLETLSQNKLTKLTEPEFKRLVRYLSLKQRLEKEFHNIPELNYNKTKKEIEDLVTTQMTQIMDGRLVDFYDKNRSDAKTLRDIIRKKQRFPKNEFLKLKEAFPCILAGIRDYAEYIPLEPEIFDLVIIDEASQVSIAQAFPALLRAKKVLILGDKKQFSNIKSAQARTATNREYLNELEKTFEENITNDPAKVARLSKFNIKTSILEFFEYISNYHTQLLKYFRGYKETISYSNKYFYQDNLQVMKIRGKPIDDVLKFSFIEHDGKEEIYRNANTPEIEFIIEELRKLKENNSNSSVCIITPHTNQQKLFMEMISKLPDSDYFFDKLDLKIFTFDTCQGEERDIVFYSMVATEESDRLWGVFIKDLSQVNIEEDGQIKAQRLNVGLSRAKECMHFVLSKSLDKFSGSIGEALRYYANTLEEAKEEPLPNEVDSNSPKEKEVLNWIMQTQFWRDNFPDNVLLKPQFEIGKYLKQLDRTYNHPNYKIDFLLVYKDEENNEHKIIIEYDGFENHFGSNEGVNKFNYEQYYSDDDIYRQKVLEGYGYKFLRINRFNVGDNPITTLNDRIFKLIQNKRANNQRLNNIHETIEGLQNGQKKECPKCKEIRDLKDFKDDSLITGYGRFCNKCKGKTRKGLGGQKEFSHVESNRNCPICGSGMVLRTGRYGKFYGCSNFPYCTGTRTYKS